MATDVAETTADDAESHGEELEQQEPHQKFDFSNRKVKIGALLLIVMSVQVAMGYLLLPERVGNASENNDDPAAIDDTDIQTSVGDVIEVDIGSFNTTNGTAIGGTIIHVSFQASATVSASQAEAFKNDVSKDHSARVRQAIEKVVRSSGTDELYDSDQEVIKRQIKSEVNKILRKTYISEVIIYDYRTTIQ